MRAKIFFFSAIAAFIALNAWAVFAPYALEKSTPAIALSAEQDLHAARGFGSESARVDSQITLKIPAGQADSVYQYLKGKYAGQGNILAGQFPGLDLRGQDMSDVSIFTDSYYDTPDLVLFRSKNSARHRLRVNTTNPDDRKSGRELVQVKITPPDRFVVRSELKYKVSSSYSWNQGSTGSHPPLWKIVARGQREDFKKQFADAGLDPLALRHITTIRQSRSRVYINMGSTNILSFSVDQGSTSMLWAKGSFASVDIGLVEIAYTETGEEKRQLMWKIREALIADLKQHFPGLVQNSDSKYGLVLEQLIRQIPGLPRLLAYQLI